MVDEESVEVETVTPKTTKATARSHTFLVDKPVGSGGGDRAPMASEYFLAAIASCHITTAHKVAERRGAALSRIRIRGRQWIDGDFITKIHLDIFVQGGLSQEERETVFRLTERICTLSKATKVPIERVLHDWPAPP